MMFSYIFFFDDKTANVVVESNLTDALSHISSDRVSHIVKVECPPFEVL